MLKIVKLIKHNNIIVKYVKDIVKLIKHNNVINIIILSKILKHLIYQIVKMLKNYINSHNQIITNIS